MIKPDLLYTKIELWRQTNQIEEGWLSRDRSEVLRYKWSS